MKKIYRKEEVGESSYEIFDVKEDYFIKRYGKTIKEIYDEDGVTLVIFTYGNDISAIVFPNVISARNGIYRISINFSENELLKNLPYEYYKMSIIKATDDKNYFLIDNELIYLYNKERMKIYNESEETSPSLPEEEEIVPSLPSLPEDGPEDGPSNIVETPSA